LQIWKNHLDRIYKIDKIIYLLPFLSLGRLPFLSFFPETEKNLYNPVNPVWKPWNMRTLHIRSSAQLIRYTTTLALEYRLNGSTGNLDRINRIYRIVISAFPDEKQKAQPLSLGRLPFLSFFRKLRKIRVILPAPWNI
jgi:hypothetical protein